MLRREVLERVSRGGPSHLFHDLLLPMIEDGWQLETQPHVGLWLEFTTPDGYRRALGRLMRQADREGRIELPGGDVRVERHREGVIFCAADATCERGATACGAVVVESGARLRRGAIVDDCVLLEGSEAGSGSVLRQAVLGEHARAGASDRIRGGCLTARHVEPRSTATSRAADGTVADDAS